MQKEQYFYNTKTHRLHIKGLCKESNNLPYNVKFFDSENEALAFDGRSVGMCKICLKAKELKLKNER